MKAEDLMLGNYINENFTIESIFNKVYVEMDSVIRDKHLNKVHIQELKPIPLTEDWLLRFGFKKEGGEYYNFFLGGFTIEVFGTKLPLKDREYRFRSYGNELKLLYVHQLQNLYKALTGEQLIKK